MHRTVLEKAEFKRLIACTHFKSLSTLDFFCLIPVIWTLNIILLLKEHKEVFFKKLVLSSSYLEIGWGSIQARVVSFQLKILTGVLLSFQKGGAVFKSGSVFKQIW